MGYDVHAERADPRPLAASAITTNRQLGADIIRLLDQVWPVLREPAGVNWEVYGDWDDDPAKRRTDVYFLLQQP